MPDEPYPAMPRLQFRFTGDIITVIDLLKVIGVCVGSQDLAKLAQRTMRISCTIQDGHIWLGDNDGAVEVALTPVIRSPSASH